MYSHDTARHRNPLITFPTSCMHKLLRKLAMNISIVYYRLPRLAEAVKHRSRVRASVRPSVTSCVNSKRLARRQHQSVCLTLPCGLHSNWLTRGQHRRSKRREIRAPTQTCSVIPNSQVTTPENSTCARLLSPALASLFLHIPVSISLPANLESRIHLGFFDFPFMN